ncbi:MAG: hypothetical protein AAGM38_11040 [Pseudomonadota bacterium]
MRESAAKAAYGFSGASLAFHAGLAFVLGGGFGRAHLSANGSVHLWRGAAACGVGSLSHRIAARP